MQNLQLILYSPNSLQYLIRCKYFLISSSVSKYINKLDTILIRGGKSLHF